MSNACSQRLNRGAGKEQRKFTPWSEKDEKRKRVILGNETDGKGEEEKMNRTFNEKR